MALPTPSKAHQMTYAIGRGEQGVLTFEPYKSHLLPLWRFRTVPIAQESSSLLWDKFLAFYKAGDFVGMDMSRKFIQMGMTRAKRYANHKGGRKYDGEGRELERSKGHEGMREKEEASKIFREVWERCRGFEGYLELKGRWVAEKKRWEMDRKMGVVEDCEGEGEEEGKEGIEEEGEMKEDIKEEEEQDDEIKQEEVKVKREFSDVEEDIKEIQGKRKRSKERNVPSKRQTRSKTKS